jgi:hypothetical protein
MCLPTSLKNHFKFVKKELCSRKSSKGFFYFITYVGFEFMVLFQIIPSQRAVQKLGRSAQVNPALWKEEWWGQLWLQRRRWGGE